MRRSDLSRAQDNLKRRMQVAQTGAVSQKSRTPVKRCAARRPSSMPPQELASNRSLTANTTIADHPNVLAAAAKVRDSYINYARNTLPAPVTGYVAKRPVQVGQRVSPGNPFMAIVPLNAVWESTPTSRKCSSSTCASASRSS